MLELLPNIHVLFVLLLVIGAIVSYALEIIPMELTSILIIVALLAFFHFVPMLDGHGDVVINSGHILQGFSNPALLTVLCLLVMGQAIVQTGALNEVANVIMKISGNHAWLSIGLSLVFVAAVSAFLNNTPVVVIFIPIMAVMAKSLGLSVSRIMMPLSFASILGGMVTLIGSSTNLLVSGVARDLGYGKLSFFEFSEPGLILAGVGFLYVLFVLPRILPDRASSVRSLAGDEEDAKRSFIAQIEVDYSSDLVGHKLEDTGLEGYKDLTIRMLQRGEHAFLPPFDETLVVRPRDVLVLSAPKQTLATFFSKNPEHVERHLATIDSDVEDDDKELSADTTVAEIVVSPASKLIGKTLQQSGFRNQFQCVVLGVERHSKAIRAKLTEIRLAAGDVLLVMGHREDILRLHESRDVLLTEWTFDEIHSGAKAGITALIFGGVVGAAALGIMPIIVAAFMGVALLLLANALNLRQAARALDLKIMLTIAASIALGTALQMTGGASFIAMKVITLLAGAPPLVIIAILFLIMAFVTNILSNNATAVLFTPIAFSLAEQLQVPPTAFLFAVIFACNCSFVTPIGYQTNLMVMGPGHYKFNDFSRAGVPLVIIIWAAYCVYAALNYDVI